MGYTNHWKNCTPVKFDQAFVSLVKNIVKHSKVAISEAIINEEEIYIIPKDCVEGFSLKSQTMVKKVQTKYPEYTGEYSFCKTGHKPYDDIVKAVLLAAISKHMIDEVSADDGEPADETWDRGRKLFIKAILY